MFSSTRVFFVILAALALTGCAGTSSRTGLPDMPPATGITQSLARRPGAPMWNIEAVGSILNAWEKKSFEITDPGVVNIVGWAVDQEAKAAAGGVEFVLEGVPYKAEYGLPRPDVAQVYKVPAYSTAGYAYHLDTRQFAPGKYVLSVRVLTGGARHSLETQANRPIPPSLHVHVAHLFAVEDERRGLPCDGVYEESGSWRSQSTPLLRPSRSHADQNATLSSGSTPSSMLTHDRHS